MPTTTRLSTTGQLILPKELRDRHQWKPGTEFEVVEKGDAVVLRPVKRLPETTLDEIVGSTGYEGPSRSLKEMEEAIEREARKHR